MRKPQALPLLIAVVAHLSAATFAANVAFWEAYEPTDSTAGLWHFDGADGERLSDASSQGQNAQPVGEIEWESNGKTGGCLAVRGKRGALRVQLRQRLPGLLKAKVHLPPPNTYPLSVEAWVCLDRLPRQEAVIVSRDLVSGKTGQFRLSVDPRGALVMAWQNYQKGSKPMRATTGEHAIPVEKWTHVAAVFQWGNSVVLYVNGHECGRESFFSWHVKPPPGLIPDREPGTMWIGNDATLALPFPGLIDEVRLATDVFELFPLPDNSWTDPQARRKRVMAKPYAPDERDILFYASFDQDVTADRAGGSPKGKPQEGAKPVPGVRGNGIQGGAGYPSTGNLDLNEGSLEFWFQPVGYDNVHHYHCGVAGGPFMIYVFNSGHVSPGGTALVAWSRDRSWTSFDGPFRAGPYYPGRWTHLVVSWQGALVKTYIDGEFRNQRELKQGTVAEYPHWAPEFSVRGSNLYDELYVYGRMLTDDEVANCYWRYRDPTKLEPLPAVPCRTQYMPGMKTLVNWLDFRASPIGARVKRVRLSLADASGKNVWQGQPQTPPPPPGALVEAVPKLTDGRYTCEAEALDEKGNRIAASSSQFRVRTYPWEDNQIGLGDRVIPPYTPLETNGNHLKPWGRDYEIGGTGLPQQINVRGQNILARPVRLEGVISGRRAESPGGEMTVTSAQAHRVQLRAASRLSSLPVAVEAFMEYDGWYQIKVTLTPKAPVTCESLDLVCDLWPGADTLYAQLTDRRPGSKYGALPEGDGVVWHSKMLPSAGWRWGSFVPIVFLGDGDRGLWWLAESNYSWEMSDDVPCVEVERRQASRTLRFHLIAKPVTFEKPRTIEFALLASPVKPRPPNWRAIAWGYPSPHYVHDTCGYRYYGDSVDAYSLHAEDDFRALRAFLLNPLRVNPRYSWWESRAAELRAGKPLVLYGSTWMTGAGMREFEDYWDEWIGSYNWCRPMPDLTFMGRTNYGATIRWTSPRQLSATRVNFCQSQIDCFVWYHQKLVEKCSLNGTWWDNSSIGEVWEYVPGRGKVVKWNVFNRRQLTKRLATMCWESGRPPWWLMNMHVDFSWCQIAWHIENDFYIRRAGQDYLDHMSVDEFRALTRSKGGIIPQLHSHIPEAGEVKVRYDREGAPVPYVESQGRYAGDAWDVRRAIRSIIGVCLLHDVGERGLPVWQPFYARGRKRALEAMEESVAFFSAQPEFFGYWRQSAVRFDAPNVYASVYVYRRPPSWADRVPRKPRAVIVFLNANDRDVLVTGLKLDAKQLGLREIRRVSDGETRLPISKAYDKRKKQREWGELKPGQLSLKRHDYRLVVIE